MTDVRDRNVLITGAASGIGKLMAGLLGERGARLILWDINEQGLAAAKEEFEGRGILVSTYQCDLTDRHAIAAAASQVLEDHQAVDVLINNAGVVTGKDLLEASDEQIQLTFDVNALALFWTTRAFLPVMKQRNCGHIVTIASAAGLVGTAKLVDYCSSKFAAVGFNEALRLEFARNNEAIQTTLVCPFYIETGMFEGVKTRFALLLPILKPDYVAALVVRAIERNKKRVITPRFVLSSYFARLFPVAVFDGVMAFFGVSKSMDEFTGRTEH